MSPHTERLLSNIRLLIRLEAGQPLLLVSSSQMHLTSSTETNQGHYSIIGGGSTKDLFDLIFYRIKTWKLFHGCSCRKYDFNIYRVESKELLPRELYLSRDI